MQSWRGTAGIFWPARATRAGRDKRDRGAMVRLPHLRRIRPTRTRCHNERLPTMATMTHKERFLNALNRQEVDCLPCGDGLWGETSRRYIAEGKLNEGEDHCAHFDMSWRGAGWLNSTADLDFQPVTVEETAETITRLDGNGARLRYWKARSGTPEHIGFNVVDRASWERLAKPRLVGLQHVQAQQPRNRLGYGGPLRTLVQPRLAARQPGGDGQRARQQHRGNGQRHHHLNQG